MHNNIALHLLNTIVHPPPNTYLYTHLCAIWTRCHVIGCLHNARLTAWIMNLDNSWLIAPAVNNFFHDNNYRGPSHFLRCTEQDRCPKLFSEASVCIRMALCHDAFDTQWYIFCQLCLEAAQRRHTNEFMDWGSDAWTARWTDGQINPMSLEIHPNALHYTASSHFLSYFLSSLSFSPALLFLIALTDGCFNNSCV